MISKKILDIFKSRDDAECGYKSYAILITDIDTRKNNACDQESLIITTKELRIPCNACKELLNAYSEKTRTLEIVSSIDVDSEGLYYGKLTGFIDTIKEEEETQNTELLSREISILKTTLKDTIEIDFGKTFSEQPIIHITIDKKYEELYRDYSVKFPEDESGNLIFSGATITFKSLKLRQTYPEIGIIVIGDENEEFYEEEYKKMTFIVSTASESEETETEDICDNKLTDTINRRVYGANIEFVEEGESSTTNRCGEVRKFISKDKQSYQIRVTKEGYQEKIVDYDINENVVNIEIEEELPDVNDEYQL